MRFNDGSFVRLKVERKNNVCSYDFVCAKIYDGRIARILKKERDYVKGASIVGNNSSQMLLWFCKTT
jgi:hypothetical protein